MSKVRLADPVTLNGRVCFSLEDIEYAANVQYQVDGTDRYRLLVGLVYSVDIATQVPSVIVALNAPLVKNDAGGYQYDLDSTAWQTWFANYQVVKQLAPEAASELCGMLCFIVKDCPQDLQPQAGDIVMLDEAFAKELVPYLVGISSDYNKEVNLQVAKVSGGITSFPSIFYTGVVDMESFVGIPGTAFICEFGGYFDEFLSKRADIRSWYLKFTVPSPSDFIMPQLVMSNPYFTLPSAQ